MMKIVLVLVFSVVFSLQIYSQKESVFFTDITTYPSQLSDLIGTNISNDDALQVQEFANIWRKDFFTEVEKNDILKLSNILFDRKARGTQFRQLTYMLYLVKNAEKNDVNYPLLFSYLQDYIKDKKNTLNTLSNFLLSIIYVINENYLHNSSTLKWRFSNLDFTFQVTNNKFSIQFPIGTLTCYSKNDSILIEETSGTYYPIEQKWNGNNGTITWERAGFESNVVNAKLKTYFVDLNKVEFTADSATFTYGKYFDKPVMGKLTHKVMNITSPESAIYPEFDSYNKRFFFKNLYENIDYDGGFSMKGAKIIGSGNEKEDAKITVKKGPNILMEVKSKYFVFRPERINGINTIVRINLQHDSIFHNDLSFIYFVNTKEVNLLRTDEYSSKSPYYNSYHKVDMDFEQLTWKIDQPRISLTMSRGATIGKARFESQNYYNQEQFDKLQGMDAVHPLVAIRKFSRLIKSEKFSSTSFADYVGRQLNEVRQELMVMAQKGFIYYNSQTDIVTIKKRLHDYLNSSAASIDYDVVDFVSTTQAPQENASLDIETLDLYINGVKQIAVSDSQNVIIYPTKNQIIMKENRSFQFDGKVEAGLFTFYGNNFFFNYNEFKINLQNVDSVSINVLTGEVDNFGRPITRKVRNVIQHLTGDIEIDRPDNKSVLEHMPQYPRFASRENSYVYYQSKNIEGGVYPEESFYFEVYPFVLDSLDNLKKEGMVFSGKFQSSGILPPIEQQLKLQTDYSLGFQFNPRPNGIPVYEGKGMLIADINLSNNGLRGKGKLNYITSTTTSKDFKFYPDSMNTQSDEFVINEQTTNTQYPQTHAKANYIHWLPGKDKMFINQGEAPFWMFNNETSLAGKLVLEPKGLSGKGNMNLTTANINSRLFRYKAKIFDADTSQFLLRSLSKEGYTVLTEENVNSHIDFTRQKGEFAANEDYTRVDFPENKYISFLDYFKWNMDEKTLEMGSRKTKSEVTRKNGKAHFEELFSFVEEPIGPRYISVHHKQDSLNFVAPSAVYDYQKNLINASDVKLIRVADAIIYPKDGKVTIAEAAQMRTIFDCNIVANDKDRYHTIHSANVNIQGRNSFTGEGKYDFVDETESIQTLHMTEIRVDTALHTIAKGKVLETDSFTLSPFFDYQGKITINSTHPLLTFDGAAHPKIDCERPKPSWLKFEAEIDPKDVFIPIDENPLNVNNNKIFAGIFLGSDSIHTYPAFISGRRNYNDTYIHTSSGFLHYNHDSTLYEIASKDKMISRDSAGNYLSLHKTNCIEYGEGTLNLGVNLGQVKLNSYGSITYNLNNKEVIINAILGIDFMLEPITLNMMANKIDSFPNLTSVDVKQPILIRYVNETVGRPVAGIYLSEIALGKPKVVPSEVQHTLNLTSLKLKWNDKTDSYQSVGKIGVGNIMGMQINRMVDGFIEITRKRSGDFMDIYLKLDDNNFYYFGYTRGVMQVYSSNKSFLEIIRKLPLKQRVMNVPKNETSYIFMVSSDTKYRNFMRNYNRHLKGESQPDQNVDQPEEQQQDPAEQQGEQPDKEKKPEGEVIEVK